MNNLTHRETEVIKLIAQELSSKEIGDYLGISKGTVESHRKNIFMKMGVRNVAGLMNKAYQAGILKIRNK